MVNVKGKWALVTGSSRGVGRQIALFMAKEGCNLILHSRSLAHTGKLLAEVTAMGVEAYAVEAELSDPAAVNRMLDEMEEKGTPVDIVFNDAGVQIAYRDNYWETLVEDFTQSFMINTIAPAIICYRLIPKMIERGFGRVINTTSGIRNEPQQAGYSASKAALDKFTTDLASALSEADVMMNPDGSGLAAHGWVGECTGSCGSCVPGIVVGAFLDDGKSGRLLPAQALRV
ncbi:MAG: SDR family NAD(P)-dependent oxidoreductase [Eisenbergiella sp.]